MNLLLYALGLATNLVATGYDLTNTQVPSWPYITYTLGLATLQALTPANLFTWATLINIVTGIATSTLLYLTGKWHQADTLTLNTAMISTPGPANTKIAVILTTYLFTTYVLQQKTDYKEKFGGVPALPGLTLGQLILTLISLT